MAVTVYKSDGPTLDGAVKVSGRGPRQARSSQTASSGGPGMESSSPQQSELETVTVGSMPAVNTLAVESNQDGTFGIKTSVADAMPETGPGVTNRNSSASASTNSVITVGVQTGWVQLENRYKYFKEDGSGYKTGWHEEYSADGGKIWYYLEPRDDAGYMVTDWHIINGEYYYFVPDDDAGYMMIGWLEIRNKWYYFHNSDENRGIMAHDYLLHHTDGKLYYLQEINDGSMAVNKEITDQATGIVYFADENGVCSEVKNEAIVVDDELPTKLFIQTTVWNFFRKYFGEKQVAGIMGNAMQESSWNPLLRGDSSQYWGLFQLNRNLSLKLETKYA